MAKTPKKKKITLVIGDEKRIIEEKIAAQQQAKLEAQLAEMQSQIVSSEEKNPPEILSESYMQAERALTAAQDLLRKITMYHIPVLVTYPYERKEVTTDADLCVSTAEIKHRLHEDTEAIDMLHLFFKACEIPVADYLRPRMEELVKKVEEKHILLSNRLHKKFTWLTVILGIYPFKEEEPDSSYKFRVRNALSDYEFLYEALKDK